LADAIAPCARIYQGAARPDPESLAAIAAYLTGLGGKSRRPPLELQPDLRADGDYAQPRFLAGRPGPGRTLFYRACHSCHPHGTKEGLGGVLAGLPADRIVAKVREGTGLLRGAREPGAWMPFYGTDRLSDEQLAHIVAFIGALPPPDEDPNSEPSR
jgi:mono/diheme cytochrome c family protein